MCDASIEVSRLAGVGIKSRQRVRFHHAASEIIGRIVLIEAAVIHAGAGGFVQIRLEKPVLARRGDRFIVRSYSPQRVIGGGTILDPNPVKLKRHAASDAVAFLKDLAAGGSEETVAALASHAGIAGFPLDELARYGLRKREIAEARAALEKGGRLLTVEDRLFDAAVVREKERELVSMIANMSGKNALLWGVDREELKERAGLREGPLFEFLMETGRRHGTLFFKGGRVRAGSGERELSEKDTAALEKLEARIREGGFAFAAKADLLALVPDEKRLMSYLHILGEQGSVIRVSSDGYMIADSYRRLLDAVHGRLVPDGAVSIGDFKDLFGFSRKFAVPILEHLDREGFTRREGDVRKAGPKLKAAR
jgi:selenocysteine-specific elongation factor